MNYYPLPTSEDYSNLATSANGSQLRSGSLETPNFVAGSSGFKLNADGVIEIDSGTFRGTLKSGQTAYNTGTGFFVGKVSGTPKLSIGDGGVTNYLTWDGSDLTINGYVQTNKGSFGGDGSDGALSISSGTTTLDIAGARILIKNYTSISITGTAKLAFSNPHANGTLVIIKSQGNVTITSSSSSVIDVSSLGADGGAGGGPNGATGNNANGGGGGGSAEAVGTAGETVDTTTTGLAGGTGNIFNVFGNAVAGAVGGKVTVGGGAGGASASYPNDVAKFVRGGLLIGGGGGGGQGSTTGQGGSGGNGGKGGGGLFMECGGAYNFTTGTMTAAGAVGSNGTNFLGAGGGGGGGGCIVISYNTLTVDSGSYTVTGGAGGAGQSTAGDGGAGANGYAIRAANTFFP